MRSILRIFKRDGPLKSTLVRTYHSDQSGTLGNTGGLGGKVSALNHRGGLKACYRLTRDLSSKEHERSGYAFLKASEVVRLVALAVGSLPVFAHVFRKVLFAFVAVFHRWLIAL